MRKPIAMVIMLTFGLLAVLVPVFAALYLARQQGLQEESSDALTMAAEVLRRGEIIASKADGGIEQLDASFARAPCSDAAIAAMRELSLVSGYLPVLGHVQDGRLICSSLGRHDPPPDLGPVDYITSHETGIRPSVDLGLSSDQRFIGLERNGFVALIHRSIAIDVFPQLPEIGLGTYVPSNQEHIFGRGPLRVAWLTRLGKAAQITFSDGDYVVAVRRSPRYDFAAYAAIPTTHLQRRVAELASILLPIGLILGAAVAGAIVYLARQHSSLPALLRKALRSREFVLHYQPVVELASGRMVGVEALLRWPGEMRGSDRPDLFIAAAEDCGLIQQFTRYALAQIAIDAPGFVRTHPDCYISVNLSSADVHSDEIVELLQRLLDTPGIQPRNIVVEVTERSFVDLDLAKPIVEKIRALGIRVAIDDFGTGYSSLAHLTTLTTDFLKIDRVFVEAVGTDSATSEVALHIIRVAQSLGLAIIAEGVETELQAQFLRDSGVEYGQGWLFAKALPLAGLRW